MIRDQKCLVAPVGSMDRDLITWGLVVMLQSMDSFTA